LHDVEHNLLAVAKLFVVCTVYKSEFLLRKSVCVCETSVLPKSVKFGSLVTQVVDSAGLFVVYLLARSDASF